VNAQKAILIPYQQENEIFSPSSGFLELPQACPNSILAGFGMYSTDLSIWCKKKCCKKYKEKGKKRCKKCPEKN